MHEKIKDIYNSVWRAYKDFLSNGDVKVCTDQLHGVIERYAGDSFMRQFAENMAVTMAPVINALAERGRE